MKCKKAERLIINPIENELKKKQKIELEYHIQSCPKCTNFIREINWIKERQKSFSKIEPSDSLIESTIELCHSEFKKKKLVSNYSQPKIAPPNFIWAAVIAIVTISIIWFFPILLDLFKKNIISNQTLWMFVIIVQNIIMLLLAPVIFKKLLIKSHSSNQILFI